VLLLLLMLHLLLLMVDDAAIVVVTINTKEKIFYKNKNKGWFLPSTFLLYSRHTLSQYHSHSV